MPFPVDELETQVDSTESEPDQSGLPEEAKAAILALIELAEREDEFVRLQQMKTFKRHNLFWHGFQYLFWSDMDQDWRIPTHQQYDELSSREDITYEFSYVINIFKAHGESIIAALSAEIPDVQFGPRDAEDVNDRRAVDAATNCVELIQRWNRAKLLIINALFFLATEGFVASYTYNKKSEEHGTVDIPVYGKREEQTGPNMATCENCGYQEPAEDMESQQIVHNVNDPCPQCQAPLTIEPGMIEEVPFMSGQKPVPKGREIVEIYGAMNVRVPSYVSKQADAGYLIHYVDAHTSLFKDAFPKVADEIGVDPGQDYFRLMRQSSLVNDGYQAQVHLTTQKKCWIRPWYFNGLDEKHDAGVAYLRQNYPNGLYTSVIGETVCEDRDETMDKHWSITKAGPSKGVHADPLLQALVPIQEITNNLENLMVMSVEYGVPATYADTEVFDFEGQSRQEVSPGYIYPVTPRAGQSISEAFYTEKTATLSKEATALQGLVENQGQFVTGDFPSVTGAPGNSGSKTLGEYEKSRTYALQRLSIVWYFINVWWGETMHKAVKSFIEHQIEDEPITGKSQQNPGMFQTKWIRQADLQGSFDRLEPEVSSDFPVSFAQKRSLLISMFQLNNDNINEALMTPENAGIIRQYIGLRELHIPNEIQSNKQLRELMVLISGEPMEDPMSPLGFTSSVSIEPEVDADDVHIEVCVNFLASDTGQDLKESNPGAYANVVAHIQLHKQHMQMTMMPPPGAGAPGGPVGPPEKEGQVPAEKPAKGPRAEAMQGGI
jgi:hypothetical protein